MNTDYKDFLINEDSIWSKKAAVSSRLSLARKIEQQFELSLDEVVSDDILTYCLLRVLKLRDHHNNRQNVLRKYYLYMNGREFPKLAQFESKLILKNR
ncbi:hypothetical protein [Paenibacillus terrigena]|uniref:hypothetical protein n=1 Tax=Paenibacillus terrigena TaxID=369333 RepID=UPI0003614FB2|nr:hypothetical protein [Paenibacillus terrigena]